MTVYGSATRNKKTGKIIDVELEDDFKSAEKLVDRQNSKIQPWGISTEWIVVRIEVLERGTRMIR